MVLDIEQIKNLCKEMNIVPTKNKGQNFLVDETVLSDMVKAAEIDKNDKVLEIGPGFGVLTAELVKRAGKVRAVELDDKLFGYLQSRFAGQENLELINGDILEWVEKGEPRNGTGDIHRVVSAKTRGRYKIAANLPYQITSRVLRLFLEADKKPAEMIVMIQKEVGERICAEPGDMSVLAVMVQYYGHPKIVRTVDKKCFWPVPEVDSVILRVEDIKAAGKFEERLEKEFFRVVKVGFSSRRKMLKKNLGNVFEKKLVDKIIKELGLNERARAQELSVANWMQITKQLSDK